MSGEGDDDDGAIQALIAVTSAPEVPGRPEVALQELLTRVLGAAGAQMGALWAPRVGEDGSPGTVVAGVADPAEVRAELADAFADVPPPEIEVRVYAHEAGPHVAALGRLGARVALMVPMVVGEFVSGIAILGYRDPEPMSLHPLRAHAVRTGVRTAGRIFDSLRVRSDLERAMAQILLTDERMLGRMGLDIHDGPTQQLSVALLEVQLLEAELADAEGDGFNAPESLRSALARIYETVGGALHEMRELIGHLRPAKFEDRRLTDILQDVITTFENGTDCTVTADWEGEFAVNGVSITQRITLYRILQEALNNAHRHGAARHVDVRVVEDQAGIAMVVRDDGRGFDAHEAQRRRPGVTQARFGLHGMRDRAEILGGDFGIESAVGEGTTVRIFLPRWSDGADIGGGQI